MLFLWQQVTRQQSVKASTVSTTTQQLCKKDTWYQSRTRHERDELSQPSGTDSVPGECSSTHLGFAAYKHASTNTTHHPQFTSPSPCSPTLTYKGLQTVSSVDMHNLPLRETQNSAFLCLRRRQLWNTPHHDMYDTQCSAYTTNWPLCVTCSQSSITVKISQLSVCLYCKNFCSHLLYAHCLLNYLRNIVTEMICKVLSRTLTQLTTK